MTKHNMTRSRYDRVAPFYDLMELPLEIMHLSQLRRKLWAAAQGEVLELGVGTGRNMKYWPAEARITGIDISPRMLARAQLRAARMGLSPRLMLMDIENLEFPPHSFDTVVATCVFCSVPDPIQGLREAARVCRPGGQILLLEHVRSMRPWLGRAMDILNPLTLRLVGANINRDTLGNMAKAGLAGSCDPELSTEILKLISTSPGL